MNNSSNAITVKISKKVFNDVYLPILDNEDRYLVIYGGGSSGKSYSICQRWVYLMMKRKMNLLVIRQTGSSNRTSTFALFKQIISKWNLSNLFKINESDMRIKCLTNKNEIVFAGLDDVEKLKSITFTNGELTHIWVEEATETTEADINQLKIRLRGGTSKKQMVLSFNPIDINHWIKKHFVDSELATVLHTTYLDNKFLTEDDKAVLESFKLTDPYYYDVYCKGNWGILGKTFFDARKIQERLTNLKKPLKCGYFAYDYNGIKITNIEWVNDSNGFINIYELPSQVYNFGIGGDTAGEGSDYYTAHVINAHTGNQSAVLRHQMDSDLYARQMYCLGKYYGNALIGIESNFDTYPIKEITRYGYKKQYIREREDTLTNNIIKSYGFKTTSLTRPVILSELVKIVRESVNKINDKQTLEEMLTFVRNEKGRPEASHGTHDDLVMGLAIAYRILEQVDMTKNAIDIAPHFNFNVEKNTNKYDYGEVSKFL